MILTLRTDKPEAELGLYDGQTQLAYVTWEAHRALAETLHSKVQALLHEQGVALQDLTAVVVYQGPGSFTGLRIGISVANTLAYALDIPVVGTSGDEWRAQGIANAANAPHGQYVLPEYGAPVHITQQKK